MISVFYARSTILEQDLHLHTLRLLPPMNSEINITSKPIMFSAESSDMSKIIPIKKTMIANNIPVKLPVEIVFFVISPPHC